MRNQNVHAYLAVLIFRRIGSVLVRKWASRESWASKLNQKFSQLRQIFGSTVIWDHFSKLCSLQAQPGQGWPLYQQLLIDLFKFLYPFLRNAELIIKNETLYKGTLRCLLVLLHDFPEFLCDYHFPFCDVIPPGCLQLRNIILSAFPSTKSLPDPFSKDLKVWSGGSGVFFVTYNLSNPFRKNRKVSIVFILFRWMFGVWVQMIELRWYSSKILNMILFIRLPTSSLFFCFHRDYSFCPHSINFPGSCPLIPTLSLYTPPNSESRILSLDPNPLIIYPTELRIKDHVPWSQPSHYILHPTPNQGSCPLIPTLSLIIIYPT